MDENENYLHLNHELTDAQLNLLFPGEDKGIISNNIKNLPIYVITSSDEELMSGTWFWYEWWHSLEIFKANNQMNLTIKQVYEKIHAKNPKEEYDLSNSQAIGTERIDALIISQFYGKNEVSELSLENIFSA